MTTQFCVITQVYTFTKLSGGTGMRGETILKLWKIWTIRGSI